VKRFVCLAHLDDDAWAARPAAEQEAIVADYRRFHGRLRREGRFLAGWGLEPASLGATIGPDGWRASGTGSTGARHAVGGVFVIAADDLAHAVRILSRHPGLLLGPIEVRPVDEVLTEHVLGPASGEGRSTLPGRRAEGAR
jgi:hypothetical protein